MNIRSCVGVLLLSVLASTAYGRGVAVNFVGLKPEAQTLAPADVAGAGAAAQSHWNNLTISNNDPNGHTNAGSLDALVDDSADAVKGMTVSVGATSTTGVWPQNAEAWGFNGANLTMVSGEVHAQAHITVSGVPYAKYDVYLYAAAGGSGGQGSAKIAVAKGATGTIDATNTYFYNFNWQAGKFVKATAKTLAEAQKSAGSNYIVFAGNSANAFTVDWNGLLGGGWTGVAGIQIVEAGAQANAAKPPKVTIYPCEFGAPACRPDYGLKIKYRWDAKPLAKNYTVFVHFIAPDGSPAAFQQDHAPKVPTSIWSGKVEYEQCLVVPGDTAPGDYKVIVGLYDGTAADRGWDHQQLIPAAGVTPADDLSYQVGVLKIATDAPLPTLPAPTLDLNAYKLTFEEQFKDLSVSSRGPCGPSGTRWMAHTPGNSDFGDARFMDPGPESPFSVVDGHLRITARKDPAYAANDAYKRQWRAGLLASIDPQGRGFSQKYGYFEAKAKFPPSKGMWPAFWLLSVPGSNPPGTPGCEIDAVEQYGCMPHNLCMTLHQWGPDNKHDAWGSNAIVPDMTNDFHRYGVLVDEQNIIWYFDGAEMFRRQTPDFAKVPLYLLVNLAMGSGWPIDKAISPSYMDVQYVRVYAKK